MAEASEDRAAAAALTAAFTVTRAGDRLEASSPRWFGDHLFGGVLIGQAVAAATAEAPEGRRIHSLHGYFLRPGRAGAPVSFAVAALREGRTMTQRTVDAWQDGRHLFSMTCSLAADTDGYDYELPPGDVLPPPEDPPVLAHPWHFVRLGPTPPEPDGTRRSTSRAWVRTVERLPDDAGLHAAIVGLFSDFTFTGGRPLHLDGGVDGLVSLDHALWLHRPVRADEWLLYDVHSLVNAGGRGLLRGTLHTRDGRLVASTAQEMRIHPVPPGGDAAPAWSRR